MTLKVGELYASLTLDSKDFNKGIKDAEGAGNSLGSALGKVGQIAAGFLAANVIQGGLQKMTSAIGDSVSGWKDHLLVMAQTDAALKSTAGAVGLTTQQLEDMADGFKATTLFEDDSIQSAENLLLTFTNIGGDVFPMATGALLDMAQALGTDASGSAIQLGKALNDPKNGITALTRVGVTFTDEQKDQIAAMQDAGDMAGAQTVILNELNKEFGGSAKAASDAAGGSAKYADVIDDLQDTIGKKLMPVYELWQRIQIAVGEWLLSTGLPAFERFGAFMQAKLVPVFNDVVAAAKRFGAFFMDTIVPAVEAALPRLEAIGSSISATLIPALTRLGELAKDIAGKAQELFDKFGPDKTAMLQAVALVVGVGLVAAFVALGIAAASAAIGVIAATLPFVAIAAVIALVALGIVELVKHWDDITTRFPIVGQAVDALQVQFGKFTDWIMATFVPAVKNIADTVADAVRTAVAFVVDHWDQIRAFIEPALKALVLIFTAEWDAIQIIFETVFGVIQGLLDVFIGLFTGDWGRMWDGIKQIAQTIWDGIVGLIGVGIDLIKGLAPIMLEAGKALIQSLYDGAINLWDGVLKPWLTGLPMTIKGAIGDLGMLLWDLGSQALTGLWHGMQNAWNAMTGWVTDIPGKILGIFQRGLQINSPSKVMIPIGEGIIEGIADGAESTWTGTLTSYLERYAEYIAQWGADVVATMTDTFKQALAISAAIAQQAATSGTAAILGGSTSAANLAAGSGLTNQSSIDAAAAQDRLRQLNAMSDADRMANAAEINRLAAQFGYTVFEDESVAMPGTAAYDATQNGTYFSSQDLMLKQLADTNAAIIAQQNSAPSFGAGVRNFGGGWARVGDRGPELLNLPRGSNVYSNRDSAAMMGGGGQTIIQINAPNYVGPESMLAEPIKRVLKSLERSGHMRPVLR